jgi:hypothetical protein
MAFTFFFRDIQKASLKGSNGADTKTGINIDLKMDDRLDEEFERF